MVYVIIPNTIKGFAISYHSDLKYNVEIENNEHFICLRSVLNKKNLPSIYRYIREYKFF